MAQAAAVAVASAVFESSCLSAFAHVYACASEVDIWGFGGAVGVFFKKLEEVIFLGV